MAGDDVEDEGQLHADPLLQQLPEVEGFRILDSVILLEKIGEGGMGTVYHGRHSSLDIDVAVKLLREDLPNGDGEFVARFKREARIAASINSPYLIRVFDVNQCQGLHYLIMEFVRGETARERVVRKGPLGVDEAITIVRCAARGLASAHAKGIIHRDIKPDNIMISSTGEVKVADLGLAKAGDEIDNLKTRTGMLMGTPKYMPPEQYSDAHSVGPQGDVYALAATLYFLLAGKNAISSGSLVEVMHKVCNDDFPDIRLLRPDVPDALAQTLLEATAKDPNRRLGSVCDLESSLASNLSSSQLDAVSHLQESDPQDRNVAGKESTVPSEETLERIKLAIESSAWRTVGSESPTVATMPQDLAAAMNAPAPEARSRATRKLSGKIGIGAALLTLAIAGIPWLADHVEAPADENNIEVSETVLRLDDEPPVQQKTPNVRDNNEPLSLVMEDFPKLVKRPVAFLRGRIQDSRSVTVRACGQTWPIAEDGRFTIRVDLRFGRNSFTVTAKSEDGRETHQEVVIRRPPPRRPRPPRH